jgi:hypothetical protein
MAKHKLPQSLQDWVEARRRHRLSHAHTQMAREQGMNPRKLGKLDNHDQEPWKVPLPQFIEQLYFKSFGRERPAVVMSIEERARAMAAKRAARKEAKRRARALGDGASARCRSRPGWRVPGRGRGSVTSASAPIVPSIRLAHHRRELDRPP